jgi:hypothetical protein
MNAAHSQQSRAEESDVEIRAFRGTERSSVYRECVVPIELFRRLLATGKSRRLRSLSALDPYGPHKLDREHAKQFAEDVAVVQDTVNEPRFAEIVAVARWCAHSTAKSWLRIVGR